MDLVRQQADKIERQGLRVQTLSDALTDCMLERAEARQMARILRTALRDGYSEDIARAVEVVDSWQ